MPAYKRTRNQRLGRRRRSLAGLRVLPDVQFRDKRLSLRQRLASARTALKAGDEAVPLVFFAIGSCIYPAAPQNHPRFACPVPWGVPHLPSYKEPEVHG
ncbi:hypothetical protein PFLCHA0_c41810 [Pseudomonas protegens CHA0]|uniref:Uncharacterized protein n=1 Tax=Pseudomonas protegens (strain DSM 19095 / LMG 27888 / CFBP 6595 / CHA0) TaxID=1124983 RepID=A0A2C9EQM6_PSEPH|nr:hypothetical protein PFLCHA0_c41810 [Pseudomonas protegens CHA0]